jgi:molybdopterin/thiamine biosynthesis adenylyltransferase/nitroreductase
VSLAARADTDGYRPGIFDLSDPVDRRAWQGWRQLESPRGRMHFHDRLADQIAALVRCRNPKVTFTPTELERAVADYRNGRAAEDIGVWVYYPWRQAVVHLLPEDDFIELRTSRNLYKITADEQHALRAKVVGIAGLSVGSQIALTMAIERTCGELRLADFDALELSNLNRLRQGVFDLGLNKAVLAARAIAEIDPFLRVACYEDGLTPANLDDFLTGGGRVDVLVEECDGLAMKLCCRQRARELRIPVVMEANDRATLDIERFDREPQRPILHGLLAGHDLDRIGELTSNEDKVPILMPMVGETTMSDKLRASLLEVGESLESWPQLASDVALGAGLVTNVVRRILLDQLTDSGRWFVDLEQLIRNRRITREDDAIRVPAAPREAATPEPEVPVEPGQLELPPETLTDLLAAAALAPSGGNEQPWSWLLRGPTLSLRLTEPFGDVLLNFRDVPRWIAAGAAAENLVLRAHQRGVRLKVVRGDDGGRTAAHFRFFAAGEPAPDLEPLAPEHEALAAQIPRRHTNRRVTAPAPLPPGTLAELAAAFDAFPGCRLHVVRDPTAVAELADITARAERIRMLLPAGHRDLVREVRWTPEEARQTRDGIDLATLDLTAAESAGLRMLREPGVARLLRKWKRGRALEKLSRRAIGAAPAVGLVTAPGAAAHDHFVAGRAIQRGWLTASKLALAVQPHTAALYLFARAFGSGAADFDAETLLELSELNARFDAVVGVHPNAVFLFRIFPACEPPGRSLRRPVSLTIRRR